MAHFRFGPHLLQKTQVFYISPLSFAFVNLKPVVPGHVLVSPRRPVKRFVELTHDEVGDLWRMAQKVGQVVEKEFSCTSLSLTIQDGPEAGQSVAHVHIHVLPRKSGDFANNDDIYDDIDKARVDNDARQARTSEEMATESDKLRKLFYPDSIPSELL